MELPEKLHDYGWISGGAFYEWPGPKRWSPNSVAKQNLRGCLGTSNGHRGWIVWVYEGSDGSWWTFDRHTQWRGYPDLDTAIAATLLGKQV